MPFIFGWRISLLLSVLTRLFTDANSLVKTFLRLKLYPPMLFIQVDWRIHIFLIQWYIPMASEREGFEPSMRFPPYSLSRGAPSATRPSLHTRKEASLYQYLFFSQQLKSLIFQKRENSGLTNATYTQFLNMLIIEMLAFQTNKYIIPRLILDFILSSAHEVVAWCRITNQA